MASKNTHKSWHKRNFTIVELIVVMLIMATMLVILLPSFTHLGRNHKLNQSAQEIVGQIAIARSYAMANHCFMAVVFPQKGELEQIDGSPNEKNESTLPDFYNASCRIALVRKDDDGYYEFVMWKPDSNWVVLPEGTYIPEGNNNFDTMSKPLKNVRIGDFVKLYKTTPTESQMAQTIDIDRYIVIYSDGTIATSSKESTGMDSSNEINIRVTEGSYVRQIQNFKNHERSKGKQVYQHIKIDPLTGRSSYTEVEE